MKDNNNGPERKKEEEKLKEMIDAQEERLKQKSEKTEDDEPARVEESAPQDTGEDEELQTRYLRLAADFQNFKKRVEKEKGDIYAYANEKIVTDLLDVIDNFERALSHGENSTDKGMLEGMEMIYKQFMGVLIKCGLEEIEAEGKDFDPNFHHAVVMESHENFESGKITGVLQRGYLLNNRVIRPSMVKVAQ
ncbi:MAG: nucleotide exchange factor GrpE [Anaerovoracaceae bacterium]|jgi:molecular chaperone GrpE